MELEYLKERCTTIGGGEFKARLLDIAHVHDRFKQDPDHRLRDNLKQLEQDILASEQHYQLHRETWTSKEMAIAAGFIILLCIALFRLYEIDVFAFCGAGAVVLLGLALHNAESKKPFTPSTRELRELCSMFAYSIDQAACDADRDAPP
ncbi:hypothetical protein BC940DRAFT_294370, partial [Gongronella butleri]